MLDLLCVSPKVSENPQLVTVLPRLESETNLDFQVTRRCGDLFTVIDGYLRVRQDTLMLLINVSDQFRNHAKRYQRTGKWFHTTQFPVVKLIDEVMLT